MATTTSMLGSASCSKDDDEVPEDSVRASTTLRIEDQHGHQVALTKTGKKKGTTTAHYGTKPGHFGT